MPVDKHSLPFRCALAKARRYSFSFFFSFKCASYIEKVTIAPLSTAPSPVATFRSRQCYRLALNQETFSV
jgi:hypothetical protein